MTQKSSDAFEQPVVAGTEEELRAYQKGVAVLLMPVRDGWKVSYLSGGDWEQEPGTEFATFDEAVQAISALLPQANSVDERAKAQEMEELLKLRREAAHTTQH